MRPLVLLFLFFPLAAQATLLKCTDAKGNVTYTNAPCAKAGLKEAAVIPPPPPPALDKPARIPEIARAPVAVKAPETVIKVPETAKPAVEKIPAAGTPKNQDMASLKLMKSMQAGDDKCAKVNAAMGRIMDEMDAARRQGTPVDADAARNESLKNLQADKNRLGCF